VVFCLVYYNGDHQCIGQFTGAKIRQYPAGKGSTSVAIPYADKKVAEETIRFFDAIPYTGFGSMEFKKHDLNGRYYIIEPTVGRVDMQELVAALNGVNLPLIAYNALTGHAIAARKAPKKAVIFINEFNEMKRLARALLRGPYRAKSFINWSVKGKRVFAYSSWKDPLVGVMLIYKIMNMALRGVKRKLFS
jgi:predicted ATP-grasp superfamily ATP-dependent carboligase